MAPEVLPPQEFELRLSQAASWARLAMPSDPTGPGTSAIAARAERLHHLWLTMAPTVPAQLPGVRGKTVFLLKRLIRRITYWYVEPRMEAQREIDAELARFATDASAQMHAATLEIERLATLVDRLQLQIAEVSARRESTASSDGNS